RHSIRPTAQEAECPTHCHYSAEHGSPAGIAPQGPRGMLACKKLLCCPSSCPRHVPALPTSSSSPAPLAPVRAALPPRTQASPQTPPTTQTVACPTQATRLSMQRPTAQPRAPTPNPAASSTACWTPPAVAW